MAKNYFERYLWLIDIISRHGYMKFEEISRAWAHSYLNSRDSASRQESYLPQRTFFNHIDAIFDTFGIEIKCNREKGYYIANGEDLEGDGVRKWLLESLAMSNMLNESRDMRDRILFEKIPSSRQWLQVIINAMRDGKALEMTYQSFERDEPHTFIAHPWCLKVFKQRWYMVARSENYKDPRIYSLDRIHDIKAVEKALRIPAKFNATEFFAKFFGICIDAAPAEIIRLRVDAGQAKYFDSLPLHESQKKVEEDSCYAIYELCLVPTFDFRQEILRNGPRVKVLAPEHFRNEVMDDIALMLKLYD